MTGFSFLLCKKQFFWSFGCRNAMYVYRCETLETKVINRYRFYINKVKMYMGILSRD